MVSDSDFETAQTRIKKLQQRPEADELLQLYALFKQVTVGDVTGKRPGMLDFKGRAKFDAWSGKAGQTAEACKQEYVNLVAQLEAKYGVTE